MLRNRIIWVKKGGMPDPVQDRLTGRHEYILHFAVNSYYYDLCGYAERYSLGQKGANPGDVWEIAPQRSLGKHLALFPSEIVERALTLACPQWVCSACSTPRRRMVDTGARRRACDWTDCGCGAPWMPGVVLDPFMGTGTTLDVARDMGRSAIGVDLDITCLPASTRPD